MTPGDAEALILFLLYCLAVHVIHQERRRVLEDGKRKAAS
jgi:hypothetical protein